MTHVSFHQPMTTLAHKMIALCHHSYELAFFFALVFFLFSYDEESCYLLCLPLHRCLQLATCGRSSNSSSNTNIASLRFRQSVPIGKINRKVLISASHHLAASFRALGIQHSGYCVFLLIWQQTADAQLNVTAWRLGATAAID